TAGRVLAGAAQLGGLRVLEVKEGLGDGALAEMASAPWLGGLTSLALAGVGGVRKSAAALARSPHAPRLRRLHLDFVQPGKKEMAALVASPLTAELRELKLEGAYFGSPGKAEPSALAAREWPHLRSLSLRGNQTS